MNKKKTSVYLSEEDRERLARIAERKGESQAWVLREALAAYDASLPDRNFAIFDMWKQPLPPGAPGIPHFDDPQEFNDWLDKEMSEGLLADLEQQLEDARHWTPKPK
ncbi:MAG: CopG family transcriptional regulator [bacterium]